LKTAFYGLDTEPEPEPLLVNKSRNRGRNFSKFGTGTKIVLVTQHWAYFYYGLAQVMEVEQYCYVSSSVMLLVSVVDPDPHHFVKLDPDLHPH
jgi:hypothetical protein